MLWSHHGGSGRTEQNALVLRFALPSFDGVLHLGTELLNGCCFVVGASGVSCCLVADYCLMYWYWKVVELLVLLFWGGPYKLWDKYSAWRSAALLDFSECSPC